MPSNGKQKAALDEAIHGINPTAPPVEVAECLRAIAEKHSLTMDQTAELIKGFFSHFDIDMFGPPPMAILRSGYQITADENPQKVVAHLANAIVGESTVRFTASVTGNWEELWKAIAAEVEHIAYKTHEASVRILLAQLLLDAAHSQWSTLVNEIFPFLEVDSLPTADITAYLQLAKRKLVLLLGSDTGDGLRRLDSMREAIEAHGYHCQLIRDLPEHVEMGLIGKVLFCALSARFVVVENSTPSGHLYELPFVRMAESVIAILQREGHGATWMTEDMIAKHPLLARFKYSDESLSIMVAEAIQWAEGRIAENIKANRGAWPWANM